MVLPLLWLVFPCVCMWGGAAGAGVNRLVGEGLAGLDRGPRGRILADRFLRSTTDPSVFVLGDNAEVQGEPT